MSSAPIRLVVHGTFPEIKHTYVITRNQVLELVLPRNCSEWDFENMGIEDDGKLLLYYYILSNFIKLHYRKYY